MTSCFDHKKTLVRMSSITKTFPGVKALDQAQLELERGEVHILLGENGAGKSTLMKILCGHYPPDKGQILLEGKRIYPKSPYEAERLGISMIHQEINLIEKLSVAENIFLGNEFQQSFFLDQKKIIQQTKSLLEQLASTLDPRTLVQSLSISQKQIVAIAKALRTKTKVLIMDEPTAALSKKESEVLYHITRSLCKRGVGVVFISHRMDEIFRIGHQITILRDGAFIAKKPLKAISTHEIIKLMVGRELTQQFPQKNSKFGPTVLQVHQVAGEQKLKATNFSIKSGEILGIAGLMGSGRTSLIKTILGISPLKSGHLILNGKKTICKNPTDAIRKGFGFITEDRKNQGLFLKRSVKENLSISHLNTFTRKTLLNTKKEEQTVHSLLKQLNVQVPSIHVPIANLSGGSQQKVLLARWLVAQCEIFIVDEPTRGIDVVAKQEIYQFMHELAAKGLAMIVVSSDLLEVLGISHRIAVMHEGQMMGILEAKNTTQAEIMSLALGQQEITI